MEMEIRNVLSSLCHPGPTPKFLTAQRPRTYTHPTRPIKLLGPPHAYPQPAPTGQAPVVYAARCIHVPPGSNS
jgi:hypothetical protein